MNEPATPSPERQSGENYELPSQGYELRDVNVWYVLAFAAGLALMVVAVLPLIDWTFKNLEQGAAKQDVPRSPLAGDQEPPAPRLQSKPSASLAAFRRREEKELRSYRWIDKQQGVVQIPVERAMELLLKRGLPEPKAQPQQTKGDKSSGADGKPASDREGEKPEAQQ